ncbi:MAG: hypothetical protein EF813_09725 [Methanosarcinales archaeon]|nr:MAG: hypothetical protein EF813_09725 [Methanosarcinales archaeon]
MVIDITYTALAYATHYTAKIVPIIAIGIFVTSFAVNTGLMKKFGWLTSPLASIAKISTISAMSVVTCVFSTVAGYSMLVDGLKEKMISEREVIATTMISSFPSILSHLFTFFVPVVIPILGYTTGSIYVCIVGLISFLKSCIGVLLARFWMKNGHFSPDTQPSGSDHPSGSTNPHGARAPDDRSASKKSADSTYKLLKRIVPTMFITLFLVSVAFELNFFESFSVVIGPITRILGLEGEVALITAIAVVNSYAGIILAGSLLSEGAITTKSVLIALLLGNVVTLSARSAKHSLPLHVSLFGPRLGSKTVAINAAATFAIDALFIAVLLVV